MHRVRGGILAGVLFVLPGLVSLTALSLIYAAFGHFPVVQALFFGLKAAVLAIVIEAVQRVGKRALNSSGLVAIAVMAFVAMFFFAVPFPLIVIAAALAGYVGSSFGLTWFRSGGGHGAARSGEGGLALIDERFARQIPDHVRPSAARFVKTALIGGAVWLGPLVVLLTLGPADVFTAIALFNSKMAVVTFGGAYAVLAYMAQQAVETYHWLKPGEMLVGLGFAETTPGPLISVVQFVGFMAAFRQAVFNPYLAGVLGGFLAMWSTFVPPFLWIFLGGPYMEALIGNRSLNAALSAITAAVVGVIANLAVWFALHTLFGQVMQIRAYGLNVGLPVLATLNVPALLLAAAAMLAIFRFRLGLFPTLAVSALAGLALYAIGM